MSWKKSSVKLFNIDYLKLLLKRHLWLAYVPLGIYFAFFFLFAILGINLSILSILFFPYALMIVPGTALILYNTYTKKSEASHVLSLPMSRIENFCTTYLAGLILILVPIFILSITTAAFEIGGGNEAFRFIFMMQAMAVIYYTLSSLGCILGGTVLTQMMMMAVVSFGPILLYTIILNCVEYLAFGDVHASINDSWIAILCPLPSGFEFMSIGHWSMWGFHILEMIVIFGLSLYLAKIRPIELSGQFTVFKKVQDYVLKPMFYLNLVYIIFYICAAMVFNDSTFDFKYYVKIIALLAGTGFIVAFLMNVWFSHDFKSLLTSNTLVQTVILTLISCFFIFVPLRQKERSRVTEPTGNVHLELCQGGVYSAYSCYGFSTLDEDSPLTNQQITEILKYINEHRELFVKSRYSGNREAYEISFLFSPLDDDEDYSRQSYYIFPENIDDSLKNLVNVLYYATRDQFLDSFMEMNPYYFQTQQGAIYESKSYLEAMKQTLIEQKNDELFKSGFNRTDSIYYAFEESFYENFYESIDASSYEEWLQKVQGNSQQVLSSQAWQEICTYLTTLEGQELSQYMRFEKDMFMDLLIHVVEIDDWFFTSVQDDVIEANIPISVNVLKDTEINDDFFFADTEAGMRFDVVFKKVEGKWQLSILEMKGVDYK